MRKEAGHDDVVVPRDHPGDIFCDLALAELDGVRSQVDGVASELVEALRRLREVEEEREKKRG